MISFTAKLADGKKRKLNCKNSWAEITFGDLLRIEHESKEMNPLSLLSILTGVKFDDIANSKDDQLIEMITQVTAFIYDAPKWDKVECPEKLYLGGKFYKVPTDINKIVNGQKILLTQLIKDKEHTNFDMISRAVAIMMTEPILGKFDQSTEKKVDEIEKMIMEENSISVYGAGQYFFLNSPILLSIGKNNLMTYRRSRVKAELKH